MTIMVDIDIAQYYRSSMLKLLRMLMLKRDPFFQCVNEFIVKEVYR